MNPTASFNNPALEFSHLFESSYASAYRLAYRITGNRTDAEDLTMDACARAWKAFDQFDRRYPFTSWLLRVLSNLAIDRWRRRKLEVISLEQLCQQERSIEKHQSPSGLLGASAESQVLAQTEKKQIVETLKHLADPYRTVLNLVDMEGWSYQEVAERMNCSLGTVRSRVHRGRKLFREVWEALYGDNNPIRH